VTVGASGGPPVIAIDTALRRAVVAVGRLDGSLVAEDAWVAGHRHGEELLPRLAALLGTSGVAMADITGIVVGTGPGAFTGLRVGIATAKALAHGLGVPIVGVSTAVALLAAAASGAGAADAADAADAAVPSGAGTGPAAGRAILLPAGPSDRVLIRDGIARLLPAGTEPEADLIDGLVAVDLADRAPDAAVRRGESARQGLGAALVRLGAARLARGDHDDLARLVPEYVTLPRGVERERGEVAWSRGRA
jgi:tRNA threonylcarbamoyladenosine biosynthesis protein TsaB